MDRLHVFCCLQLLIDSGAVLEMAFMQGGGQILGKLTGDKSGKGGGGLLIELPVPCAMLGVYIR